MQRFKKMQKSTTSSSSILFKYIQNQINVYNKSHEYNSIQAMKKNFYIIEFNINYKYQTQFVTTNDCHLLQKT